MTKEVCKVKVCKVTDSDKEILRNLYENREGLRTKTLIKLIGIKQRTLYKRLNILKNKGYVENIFPIWKLVNGQVEFVQSLLESSNIFELHNLGYVLKLIKKPDWWNKRKSKLMRLKDWQFSNHSFGKNNSNPYQQIINENFVIQTYPESIIIIHRKRYYSDDPYSVIEEGIINTLNIIEFLEERFRCKLLPEGIPSLELRANDFNRIKDHLAEKCKKEGTRFLVQTDVGKVWVDYSEPFGKEANTPDIQEVLEHHTKDLIVNKPMTNSEIQALVGRVAEVQNTQIENMKEFAVALNKHIPAYEGMQKEVKSFRQSNEVTVELLAQTIKDMQEAFTEQIELLRKEVSSLKGNKHL